MKRMPEEVPFVKNQELTFGVFNVMSTHGHWMQPIKLLIYDTHCFFPASKDGTSYSGFAALISEELKWKRSDSNHNLPAPKEGFDRCLLVMRLMPVHRKKTGSKNFWPQ